MLYLAVIIESFYASIIPVIRTLHGRRSLKSEPGNLNEICNNCYLRSNHESADWQMPIIR